MDLGLRGSLVLVTGASKGIGRATALAFAAEGSTVVCVARSQDQLKEVTLELERLGGKGIPRTADLSRRADVEELVREFGSTIDVLVNNAGAVPLGSLDLDEDEWRRSYEVKLWAHIRLAKGVLPEMKRRASGVIVSVAGLSAHEPRPGFLPSGIVNSAIVNMTRALAHEAGPHGVRVLAVSPGPIDTARLDAISNPKSGARDTGAVALRRLGRPEEVADAVVYLASARSSYVTGITLPVDGGALHGV